ncbi:MAG: DUF507 family protein [Deltaproteobacteria bacterium]|nr:DUF507 family protein [Deltaproteobacteria bacterium]
MKLTIEQVEKITELILRDLVENKLITLKADEAVILKRMVEIVLKDLRAEDELDREVEGMINTHSDEIDSERIDYRRMFNMVKHKLARERGITL